MSGEIPYWWLPRLEALPRSKQWHVISCSSDIISWGNQWCYSQNVGCSLLPSSSRMASKASQEKMRKQQSCQGWRKGELATISYKNFHFRFTQMKGNTIAWKMMHHQLILMDEIPGWPTINVFRTFTNTMLPEIRKIITPLSDKELDRSLLLWSVNDFWGLCGWIVFTVLFGSQPRLRNI